MSSTAPRFWNGTHPADLLPGDPVRYHHARIEHPKLWIADNAEQILEALRLQGFHPEHMSHAELLRFAREEHERELLACREAP